METKLVGIKTVKPNKDNPRVIKDDKFEKLVNSIKEFPEMLQIRPIVVNKEMVVLGGNMRLKACIEAGLKKVHIIKAEDLTEEQQKEFIIKDNVGFGEWEWQQLKGEEWGEEKLNDWGLDLPFEPEEVNLDDFFEEDNSEPKEEKNKIILEYTDEEFEKVIEALSEIANTPEQAVWKLLRFE
jgi:ParB-like chromosome segregation protein Spo0J